MIADERSLARLMVLSGKGDRAAYATLLVECQRWLRAYFARRVAPSYLDDLVQETLMALHQKLATWDSNRPFLPWLAAIARYRWVDQLRRIYRSESVELSDEIAGEDNEPAITAKISLERLMARLPEAQVRAIEMVSAGQSFFSPDVAHAALKQFVRGNGHGPEPAACGRTGPRPGRPRRVARGARRRHRAICRQGP